MANIFRPAVINMGQVAQGAQQDDELMEHMASPLNEHRVPFTPAMKRPSRLERDTPGNSELCSSLKAASVRSAPICRICLSDQEMKPL